MQIYFIYIIIVNYKDYIGENTFNFIYQNRRIVQILRWFGATTFSLAPTCVTLDRLTDNKATYMC
jgi:hypothetical protein